MGSTSEKRCFKLTSCNSDTSNQDLHAYGIMLIAATITLLLIIYTTVLTKFSPQGKDNRPKPGKQQQEVQER
ncbi:hypothetical protein CRYUN_Cryun41cG0037600 [Craigia yunnanensis]